MKTELLFLKNTALYATLVTILEMGEDANGNYFLADRTIFYPQGGGQPNDVGWIETDSSQFGITMAKYSETGAVKHYTDEKLPGELVSQQVSMRINPYHRTLHAAYHTSGHWLSQIVHENLRLPLFPVKGHHFPDEAYVEFEGTMDVIDEAIIDHIKLAMRLDLQTFPTVMSEMVELDSPQLERALLPKNFKPLSNRPLRLVTIEGYKAVPCGGTHCSNLNSIKLVRPKRLYKKGKRYRLSYECMIESMVSS